jgi:DNA invertase Pin-like site-specific DNA recombinase
MLLGYARVSKGDDRTNAMQANALRAAGCKCIFEEEAPDGRWGRPELHRLLDQLHEGDTVIVWKLDRLSRSLKDVLHIMERVAAARAGFRSLTESIDTTTSAGRMMMQMVGAFAGFERAMVRERTVDSLKSARRQGRVGGRPRKLTMEQQNALLDDVLSGTHTAASAARLRNVSPSLVSRLLASRRRSEREGQVDRNDRAGPVVGSDEVTRRVRPAAGSRVSDVKRPRKS